MAATAIPALARLTERRFQSFSEAADAVLDLLEGELPADAILIGQLDWGEGLFRILDVRGDTHGVKSGSALPLAEHAEGDHSGAGGLIDPAALQRIDVRSYLAIPFETNHGAGAITLCALGTDTNRFTSTHLDVLMVAGRMLTYEWETVSWRAQLRQMAEKLRDPESTDPVTGLPDAARFTDALDREWSLAQRGMIESYLVVCRATDLEAVGEDGGEALARLLLKDMADVLGAAVRRTDRIGRTGENEISAVLVGCKGRAGAEAFFARALDSYTHVTAGRPATSALGYGIRDLGGAESAQEALEGAREDARTPVSAPSGEPV